MILNIKNHPGFSNYNEVNQICKPLLDLFDISFFRYLRVYKNGTRINLCSDPAWTEHFYTNRFYNVAWFDHAGLEQLKKSEIIWDDRATREDNQVGIDARDRFNICHGMSIVRPNTRYCEIFDFATTADNITVNTIYLKNMDLFEKFFFYFRDKAHLLIKQAESKKIVLHDLIQPPILSNKQPQTDSIQRFLQQIDTKRYFISTPTADFAYLTKREAECVYWTILGKSTEEISIIVNSSRRTVEIHLENVKQKLGCNKTTQVVKLAIDSGLLEALKANGISN